MPQHSSASFHTFSSHCLLSIVKEKLRFFTCPFTVRQYFAPTLPRAQGKRYDVQPENELLVTVSFTSHETTNPKIATSGM